MLGHSYGAAAPTVAVGAKLQQRQWGPSRAAVAADSPVLTLGLHHRFSEKGTEVRFCRRSYRAQQGPCATTDLALTKMHGHRLWRRHSSFGGNNG